MANYIEDAVNVSKRVIKPFKYKKIAVISFKLQTAALLIHSLGIKSSTYSYSVGVTLKQRLKQFVMFLDAQFLSRKK